jgi:alpha-tubulin suppressor-like RCC1 family protein
VQGTQTANQSSPSPGTSVRSFSRTRHQPISGGVTIRARRTFGLGVTAAVAAAVLISSVSWLAYSSASASTVAKGGFGWGNNQTGEVDDGSTVMRKTPVASVGLAGVTTMSAGLWHCLAIRSNGTVIAWGHNASGELGNGTTTDSSTPVGVIGLSHVTRVASGGAFSLAERSDGAVMSWGHNASGELGDGNTGVDSSTPVRVKGLGPGSGVVAVSAGSAFGLALKSDGTVLSWGNNTSGELGNGTFANSPVPLQVKGLGAGSGVVAISAGTAFALALKSDGTVLAWGNNQSGELGDGKAPKDSSVPVAVKGAGSGSGVVAVSAGGAFALALKSDGSVLAWGDNQSGQLGNGKAPRSSQKPIVVPGLKGVRQVSAGYTHALAIAHGVVYAWGDNSLGQIGDGKSANATKPVRIGGFAEHQILGVYAGGDHSHVLSGAVTTNASPTRSPKPSRTPSPTPSARPTSSPSPHRSAKPSVEPPSKPSASPHGAASPSVPPPTNITRAASSSSPSNGIGLWAVAALAIVAIGGVLIAVSLIGGRRDRFASARATTFGWIGRRRP